MRTAAVAACFALWVFSTPGMTESFDAQAVNEAQFEAGKVSASKASSPAKASKTSKTSSPAKTTPAKQALLIKAQVLLSRAHFSPGEIDGKPGANFSKALSAFAKDRGLEQTDDLNENVWRELANVSAEPPLTEYTITEADARGPFLEKLPPRLEHMKDLPSLPSKISKSESHGCIRLTNWDALELADSVARGVSVDFVGDEQERRTARAQAPSSRRR
jgi:peptidoglycan hydrolase-like protein with peptidoglycan-binding domain